MEKNNIKVTAQQFIKTYEDHGAVMKEGFTKEGFINEFNNILNESSSECEAIVKLYKLVETQINFDDEDDRTNDHNIREQ